MFHHFILIHFFVCDCLSIRIIIALRHEILIPLDLSPWSKQSFRIFFSFCILFLEKCRCILFDCQHFWHFVYLKFFKYLNTAKGIWSMAIYHFSAFCLIANGIRVCIVNGFTCLAQTYRAQNKSQLIFRLSDPIRFEICDQIP